MGHFSRPDMFQVAVLHLSCSDCTSTLTESGCFTPI